MKTKKTLTPHQIASEVRSHVETACGEIASDMTGSSSGFLDEEWEKKIKAAKRKGVRDIQGWLADELYNDADTLQDLMGDKIHDLTGGDDDRYNAVLDVLMERAFPAMLKACTELRKTTGVRPDPE